LRLDGVRGTTPATTNAVSLHFGARDRPAPLPLRKPRRFTPSRSRGAGWAAVLHAGIETADLYVSGNTHNALTSDDAEPVGRKSVTSMKSAKRISVLDEEGRAEQQPR
jgi:hypothetical protein